MDLYILAKCQKGGGEQFMPKDLEHFKGFILLNFIQIVLNLGKMSKGDGGFGACQIYWSTFLRLLTTLDFLKVLEERTVFKSLIHFHGVPMVGLKLADPPDLPPLFVEVLEPFHAQIVIFSNNKKNYLPPSCQNKI